MTTASDVASALLARDRASLALGMELVEAAPGRAIVRMTVGEAMTNGHDTCHGGLIFTLADSAFAFACNSHNENTLAAAASIDFLRTAPAGTVLTAVAVERHRRGRSGIYDVTVTDGDHDLVAVFRGRSHTTGGPVVKEER